MPSRSPLRPLALLALPVVLATAGCSGWFFSGPDYPDRSRPLARIETQGGIEYGATTEFGVLFLGRTATEGPCRVRMFLGEQLIVDDGKIEPFGAGIWRASIDLVGQGAPLWRPPFRRPIRRPSGTPARPSPLTRPQLPPGRPPPPAGPPAGHRTHTRTYTCARTRTRARKAHARALCVWPGREAGTP